MIPLSIPVRLTSAGLGYWTPDLMSSANIGGWWVSDNPLNTMANDEVSVLFDKTGNNNHATFISRNGQTGNPIVPFGPFGTLNGRQVIQNVNGGFNFNGLNYSTGTTLAVACYREVLSSAVMINASNSSANNYYNSLAMTSTDGYGDYFGMISETEGEIPFQPYYNLNRFRYHTEIDSDIFIASINATDRSQLFIHNQDLPTQYDPAVTGGANVGSLAMANTIPSRTFGGVSPDGTEVYDGGYYGEALFIRGTPSIADILKLQGYLAWEWGTQPQLPVGHPYKDARP